MISFHEGIADCGDAGEEGMCRAGGRAWERLDKVYESIRALSTFIQALEAQRHGGRGMCRFS